MRRLLAPALTPTLSRKREREGRAEGVLLQEAFGLERLLHLGARRDAREIGADVAPRAEVDVDELAPAQRHEGIGVGHREAVAHQILALVGELALEIVEALGELRLGDGLV